MKIKTGFFISALFMASQLLACEATHEGEEGCAYADRGIQFSYPDNWQISDEGSGWLIGPSYVFVEHEESGIVILMIYSKSQAQPLEDFAKEYSAETRSSLLIGSFEQGTFTTTTRNIGEQTHQGLREIFDMLFMEERLPHTREYHTVDSTEKTIYVIMQVADEDMAEGERGLNQILGSLRFQQKK